MSKQEPVETAQSKKQMFSRLSYMIKEKSSKSGLKRIKINTITILNLLENKEKSGKTKKKNINYTFSIFLLLSFLKKKL